MTRSISRRLLLAGATATALLTLGAFAGSASASAAPAATTSTSASAADSGSLSPADVVSHPFVFYINGVFAEYLANISASGNYLTVTRGGGGQAFTDWINVNKVVRNPKNISVVLHDYADNPVRTYNFYAAYPVSTAGTQVTLYFSASSVS
ncbi:hypothetical protein ACFZAM_01385 [Streptomyces sp. NPDC008079]|uniref:hypothetical protein n=1 Tax=Streptomyces sp. NPDC008079 TaxID=3364806 RepID=UPI0036E86236